MLRVSGRVSVPGRVVEWCRSRDPVRLSDKSLGPNSFVYLSLLLACLLVCLLACPFAPTPAWAPVSSWMGVLCNFFGASCSTVAVGGHGLARNCCGQSVRCPHDACVCRGPRPPPCSLRPGLARITLTRKANGAHVHARTQVHTRAHAVARTCAQACEEECTVSSSPPPPSPAPHVPSGRTHARLLPAHRTG